MSETCSTKRRVSFAEQNECFEFTNDICCKGDLWFSRESCHINKARCIRSSRLWKRMGYDVLLNDSYQNPCSDTQSKLNAFAQLEPEKDCIPRGIERFISAQHADERRNAKIYCIEAVVDLCTYLRRQNKTLEEMEEDLKQLSLEQSQMSRVFARRIANADAQAVREEVEEEHDTKSMVTISSTISKTKRVISSRAINGTRRITRMITGHSRDNGR